MLPERFRSLLVNVAFVVLLVCFFTFNKGTLHPSFLTTIPVLATAVLIANGQSRVLATRILMLPIAVAIGLISYSLYLWHFPVLAFARINNTALNNADKLGLLMFSFLLAALAYALVEKPLRNRVRWSVNKLLGLISTVFIILFSVQTYFYVSGGATQRLGSVEDLFDVAKRNDIPNGEYNTPNSKGVLINVGDSHAGALSSSLLPIAHQHQLNFVNAHQMGCPLVVGVKRFDDGKFVPRCSALQDKWFSSVVSYERAVIVYSARFNLYFTGERFDNGEGGIEPGTVVLMTDNEQGQQNTEGLKALTMSTITSLLDQGQRVVVVYPVPEVGWNVPSEIRIRLQGVPVGEKLDAFEKLSVSTDLERYRQRSQHAYDMYDRLGEHENLVRIYPEQYLCSKREQRCFAHDDKRLFYYDDNHLSPFAANLIAQGIEQAIRRKGWLQ